MEKWKKLRRQWFFFLLKAYLLAPFLALEYENRYGPINNNNGFGIEPRLPLELAYYDTPDNSLLGDAAWKAMESGHWPWRAKFSKFPKFQAWLGRLGWLWRNPAYGFDRMVLGANIKPTDVPIVTGDPQVRDKPNGKEGECTITLGEYWAYVSVKKIPWLKGRCIKKEYGWRLQTYAEQPSRVKTEPVAPFVFSIRFPSFKED